MTYTQYQIYGFSSIVTGRRFIEISDGICSVTMPHQAWAGNGHEALQIMKNADMAVIGQQACSNLVREVSGVKDFSPINVVENVGWNGSCFALQNGDIFSPSDVDAPKLLIRPLSGKCERDGTHQRWLNMVEMAADQTILIFALLFMFAAPLLRLSGRFGNFGFELVGGRGKGKTTVQQIMSSVVGGTGHGDGGHYFVQFDTTLNAIEDTMLDHMDMPLVLEEANLFKMGDTPRAQAGKFKDVAFKIGAGTTKSRRGEPGRAEARLLYFTGANEPLASVIGENSEGAKAAADRLITIPLSPDRRFGVFDSVPNGFDGAGAFANALIKRASRHYGHAMPIFLQALVNERAEDEKKLIRTIADDMTEFRKRAEIDRSDGSAGRVADAFGLVYAAGRMAQRYGAVPADLKCGKAVLTCYKLHIERARAGLSFAERLEKLSRHPDVVDLGSGKLPKLSKEETERGIFRRDGRHGPELLITSERIFHYFPDWATLRKRDEVVALLNAEDGRQKTWRQISRGDDKLRVFSFRLS